MESKTSNYNLIKPNENDYYDINKFNQNADVIDTELKKANDKIAAHTSDTVSHIEKGEREKWNGKAEKSDIPTSLPANGGHANKADTCDWAEHANYSSNAVSATTPALRNVKMSTSSPSGGSNSDIWHQYK